jgi:hypothetical protein
VEGEFWGSSGAEDLPLRAFKSCKRRSRKFSRHTIVSLPTATMQPQPDTGLYNQPSMPLFHSIVQTATSPPILPQPRCLQGSTPQPPPSSWPTLGTVKARANKTSQHHRARWRYSFLMSTTKWTTQPQHDLRGMSYIHFNTKEKWPGPYKQTARPQAVVPA